MLFILPARQVADPPERSLKSDPEMYMSQQSSAMRDPISSSQRSTSWTSSIISTFSFPGSRESLMDPYRTSGSRNLRFAHNSMSYSRMLLSFANEGSSLRIVVFPQRLTPVMTFAFLLPTKGEILSM